MKKLLRIVLCISLILSLNGLCAAQTPGQKDRHVIIISFDGLRPDAITALGPKHAPNFHKVIAEGASTLNARTDPGRTVTMPNHTSMITGRGVLGEKGHEYIDNWAANKSLHAYKGSYVAGIFDVAKEHGLTTGFFASKFKFNVFINSYGNTASGKPSKIDVHQVTDQKDGETLAFFLKQLHKGLPDLNFLHFAGPDKAGHKYNWDLNAGSKYLSAVKAVDGYLGKVLHAIESDSELAASTVIIMTADHGGIDDDHDDVRKIENYRIPFIIWGKDVAAGMDLYKININSRQDPQEAQVPYGQPGQPIRNGDAANCAMWALGLPPVPGSTIGNPDPVKFSVNQE
jgi:predicted AlkP superfamily pyrophosphatase or phosphodiesterase